MKKAFVFSILIVSLSSCSQILDNQLEQQEIENKVSPYTGNWTGHFYGADSGTLIVSVSKHGNCSIQITSVGGNSETFYGFLSDYGAFQNTTSPNSGFTLYGNLETKSGTWKRAGEAGTWTLAKK